MDWFLYDNVLRHERIKRHLNIFLLIIMRQKRMAKFELWVFNGAHSP